MRDRWTLSAAASLAADRGGTRVRGWVPVAEVPAAPWWAECAPPRLGCSSGSAVVVPSRTRLSSPPTPAAAVRGHHRGARLAAGQPGRAGQCRDGRPRRLPLPAAPDRLAARRRRAHRSVSLLAESYSIWVVEEGGPGPGWAGEGAGVVARNAWVGRSALSGLAIMFLLAPDGHFLSPRWRYAAGRPCSACCCSSWVLRQRAPERRRRPRRAGERRRGRPAFSRSVSC